MKKPNKILGVPIKYVPKEEMDDAMGEFIDGRNSKIRIAEELSDEDTKDTLAHELMHYAFYSGGLASQLRYLSNDTSALEEGIVSCIENQLISTGVLVLNPDLFKKGKK